MSMSLQQTVLAAVLIFCLFSVYVIIQHEQRVMGITDYHPFIDTSGLLKRLKGDTSSMPPTSMSNQKEVLVLEPDPHQVEVHQPQEGVDSNVSKEASSELVEKEEINAKHTGESVEEDVERKGLLKCDGKYIDSEVIYWKIVPGDNEYESPITPHHDIHHDRYVTYEYDEGGWNNIRMSLECVLVFTHAMGRTLVSPPRQNLYLLDKKHKDKKGKIKTGMGFEDFFDLDLIKSHKGYHLMTSEEFLAKEGVTGGLHGILPPKNSTRIGGRDLNRYYRKVADELPAWTGKFLVMPDTSMDITHFDGSKLDQLPAKARERMKRFGGERTPVFYGEKLQKAHHIHFRNGPNTRLLQHHYAFSFFVDKEMQSFYKRFVRDYLRYKDEIQCAGHEIVKLVREDARAHNLKLKNPGRNGSAPDDTYYALHVRRGDFQYKDVKISAAQIVKNLKVDGVSVIPRGALVYLSTDDPKGICANCMVQRISCTKYEPGKKPEGCPEDPSWKAFEEAGWTIRFLDDYIKRGALSQANPNIFGMVESIVCSRAEVFAGTFFSSFSGYIHRLRGYHGIGEQSYYHSNGRVKALRQKKSVGHGFSREWRAGWTDDEGGLI